MILDNQRQWVAEGMDQSDMAWSDVALESNRVECNDDNNTGNDNNGDNDNDDDDDDDDDDDGERRRVLIMRSKFPGRSLSRYF